jgi:hypothetical protein
MVASSIMLPAPGAQFDAAVEEGWVYPSARAGAEFFYNSYAGTGRQDGNPIGLLRAAQEEGTFAIVTGSRVAATVHLRELGGHFLIESYTFCMDATPAGPLVGIETERS